MKNKLRKRIKNKIKMGMIRIIKKTMMIRKRRRKRKLN
jgi:hypothetical protein